MIVLLVAGIYMQADGNWDQRGVHQRRLPGDHFPLRPSARGFFKPQTRQARELAERDLKTGDTLSDEFNAVSARLGKVGRVAGLIVVVTIFFMAYKPFL